MGGPHLRFDLAPLKHGGDLERVQRETGESNSPISWLDLSSAVNKEPWPVPSIDPAMWMELPDTHDLNQAAALYYGRSNHLAVSGSQQAIEWLPVILPQVNQTLCFQKKAKVMLPAIGYQEHAQAWEKWGYRVEYYDSLNSLLTSFWDIVVVINPNNPTAEWSDIQLLEQLMHLAKERQGYLLVDEAFIDSTPEKSLLSQKATLRWPDELIVLRSVGKFFGLAGTRVGFCFATDRVLQALKQVIGPWPITTVSAHVVTCALQDTQWQKQANDSLRKRQAQFRESIEPLLREWFQELNSEFYCCRSHFFFSAFFKRSAAACNKSAEVEVFETLQSMGVHIRLGNGWLRIALPEAPMFPQLEARIRLILDKRLLSKKGIGV